MPLWIVEANSYQSNYAVSKTLYRINLQMILNPHFQVHVCVASTCNGLYNTNLDE